MQKKINDYENVTITINGMLKDFHVVNNDKFVKIDLKLIKTIFDLVHGEWCIGESANEIIQNNESANEIILNRDEEKTCIELYKPSEKAAIFMCRKHDFSGHDDIGDVDFDQYMWERNSEYSNANFYALFDVANESVDVCRKFYIHYIKRTAFKEYRKIDEDVFKNVEKKVFDIDTCEIINIAKKILEGMKKNVMMLSWYCVAINLYDDAKIDVYNFKLKCKLRKYIRDSINIDDCLKNLSMKQLKFVCFWFDIKSNGKYCDLVKKISKKIDIGELRLMCRYCDNNESYVGIYYSCGRYGDNNNIYCCGCTKQLNKDKLFPNHKFSNEVSGECICESNVGCSNICEISKWNRNIFSTMCLCTNLECEKNL